MRGGNLKKCVIVVDTETAPQPNVRFVKGPIPEKSACYDVGWVVREKRGGEVFERRSFVVAEVFFRPDMMNSAYYASKTPQYRENYNDGGSWDVKPALEVFKQFRKDCRDYGIEEIWAFNSEFDRKALDATAKFITGGWPITWAPYGVKYFDIWRAAEKITGTKSYVKWALENGFVSEKHNPQTNVEAITAYLSGDVSFREQHTGLSDVEHESAIFEKIMRYSHTPNPKTAGQGWRKASAIKNDLIAEGWISDAQIESNRLARIELMKEM